MNGENWFLKFLFNEQRIIEEKTCIQWILLIAGFIVGVLTILFRFKINFGYFEFALTCLLMGCVVLKGYEILIVEITKYYVKKHEFGAEDIFLGSIENVVLKKRNHIILKLNTFEDAEFFRNPMKSLFNPRKQIERLAQGILAYFQKIYNLESNDWNIRIAQIEDNKVKGIMVRCPDARSYTQKTLWDDKKSGFFNFLKSSAKTMVFPDLEKAAESKQYIKFDNEDLSQKSLILHKITKNDTNETLLVISIKSPKGVRFFKKLEKEYGKQLNRFGDRILIEYVTLQSILHIEQNRANEGELIYGGR